MGGNRIAYSLSKEGSSPRIAGWHGDTTSGVADESDGHNRWRLSREEAEEVAEYLGVKVALRTPPGYAIHATATQNASEHDRVCVDVRLRNRGAKAVGILSAREDHGLGGDLEYELLVPNGGQSGPSVLPRVSKRVVRTLRPNGIIEEKACLQMPSGIAAQRTGELRLRYWADLRGVTPQFVGGVPCPALTDRDQHCISIATEVNW